MPFVAHGVENPNSKRSYITTSAFNGVIYSYTTQVNPANNYTAEGKLTAITTLPSGAAVTATNCPAGRILREAGRKLYPGANPGLAVGDTYSGAVVGTTVTNHMWVGVFDSVTGLRGFIDPNASQFAVYSTDRNPAFVDAAETAGGTPTRLGPSIYTAGNVTANGSVTAGTGITMTSGVFYQYRPVASLSAADQNLTLAQTLGGIITMTPGSVVRNVYLPSTASMITALGSTVGASAEFVVNSIDNTLRLYRGDSNTTIVGSGQVSNTYIDVNTTIFRFIISVNSPTTVIVYHTT